MAEGCGLLQEKGENLFGFLHLTFEEYLASRALMESEHVDRDAWLREKWYHESWKEVIRLAVGGAHPRDASDMLDRILEMPDSAWLGHQALLAGECLFDYGGQVKSRPKVIQAMLALFERRDVEAAIRVQTGDVLNRLGDPRDLEEFVEVPGGEFPLGVTKDELAWFEKHMAKMKACACPPKPNGKKPRVGIGKIARSVAFHGVMNMMSSWSTPVRKSVTPRRSAYIPTPVPAARWMWLAMFGNGAKPHGISILINLTIARN